VKKNLIVMKNNSLTIGIPIRNEAKSIRLLIISLINAVKIAQDALPELKIQTLFCVNDTIDNSREIIKQLAFVSPLNSCLIESEPGKMNALIQIVEQKFSKNGMVCFVDADTLYQNQSCWIVHCLKKYTKQ
jgi:cellulose synthase/poly-beta-1,6-N-acetylglucosamine synthase-like glycosyltransferase